MWLNLQKNFARMLDKNLAAIILQVKKNLILEMYNHALYKQNEISKFKQGSKYFSGNSKTD